MFTNSKILKIAMTLMCSALARMTAKSCEAVDSMNAIDNK